MTQVECKNGHEYTRGKGCPKCQSAARLAYYYERGKALRKERGRDAEMGLCPQCGVQRRRLAEHISRVHPSDAHLTLLASLLEAVEPLLAAAEKATPGEWKVGHDDYGDEWWFGGYGHGQVTVSVPNGETLVYGGHDLSNAAFIVQARNTASALRDLLGPTGGEA